MSAATLVKTGPLAVMVTAALLSTACGSSSGSKSAGSTGSSGATTSAAATTPAAATTSAAASAAGASSAGGGSATSSASVPSAAQTTVKATGGGKFCKDIAAAVNDAANGPSETTPAALKAQVQKTLSEFKGLLLEAPSAVKADLQIVDDQINTLYGAIAKANYDVTKVDPTLLEASPSPQQQAASDHLDAYAKTTCGINVDS
jgi:hypothetical protein